MALPLIIKMTDQ